MRGVANCFSANELHVRATCIPHTDGVGIQYRIENSQWLLDNAGIHSPTELLSSEAFVVFLTLVRTLHNVDKNKVMLCLDANIGYPAATTISAEFCYLVERKRPSSLIAFTDTPDCIVDAKKFMRREPTIHNHCLPHYRLSGAVCDRATLNKTIRSEKTNPTFIEKRSRCMGFFRRVRTRVTDLGPLLSDNGIIDQRDVIRDLSGLDLRSDETFENSDLRLAR